MVRSKLDEHRLKNVELQDLAAGDNVSAGPFDIEMIKMAHSIPDAFAVAATCELGTTLVTGDYKFDQTPVDGIPADVARLAELGREELLLLCGDSTNANRPGIAPSETSVAPGARAGVLTLRGPHHRHLLRLERAPRAAGGGRRRVQRAQGGAGRPLDAQVREHQPQPRPHPHPGGQLVDAKEIEDFPDHKVVIIATGSQGEPLSALRRMAHADHPFVELHERDTVIFSATPIPGNERAVNETIDRIYRVGADVITTADAHIHASGHGYVEELKLMLNLTNPRYVMPMHGDHRRLRLHSQLAEAVGVEPDCIFRGENGLPLEIDEKGAGFGEREQAGMIFVDGVDIGDVEDVALRDRRMLSADGIFIVVATISEQDGLSVVPPEIIFRGVPFLEEQEELLDEIREEVEKSLERSAKEQITEISLLQQHLHDDIAEFVYRRLKRRPMVLPVVVEV